VGKSAGFVGKSEGVSSNKSEGLVFKLKGCRSMSGGCGRESESESERLWVSQKTLKKPAKKRVETQFCRG